MKTLSQLKKEYDEAVGISELCKTNEKQSQIIKQLISKGNKYLSDYLHIVKDKVVPIHISAIKPYAWYTGLHDYILVDDHLHELLKTINIDVPIGDLIYVTDVYFERDKDGSTFGVKEFVHSNNTYTSEDYLFLQDADYTFCIPNH